MRVSGFTIIRNGVKYGYPFLESIRSLLPLVEELIVVAGDSTDTTNEALLALIAEEENADKIKVIHSVWDPELCQGGLIMSQQTNLALEQCTGDWCFYLQADEVVHEEDYDAIRASMQRHFKNKEVEGLYFRYCHFMGSYDILNPLAYRYQVRIVRNGIGARSVGDACGFSGTGGKKLRTRRGYPVRKIEAKIYHYGWVKPPKMMQEKSDDFQTLYHGSDYKAAAGTEADQEWLYNYSTCQPFTGTHPGTMREEIKAKDWQTPTLDYIPPWRNLRYWMARLKKLGLLKSFKK